MSWAPSTCGMSPPPTWSASCAASTSCSTGWPRSSASALSLAPGRSSSGSSSSWQPSECPWGQWMCGDDGVQKGNGTCGNSGGCCQPCGRPFFHPPPSLPTVLPNLPSLCPWVPQSLGLLTHPPCKAAPGLWLFPLRVSGSCAHSLKEQKNLNSFFAVMFGLSNSAISRLAHTWEVGAQEDTVPRPGLCPPRGCLGWLSLPSHGLSSPVLSLQRLPHKVRKLYSALERLLVRAGPISAIPGHRLLAFHGFERPLRARIPLACGCGSWLRVCGSDGGLVVYRTPWYSHRGHLPWI